MPRQICLNCGDDARFCHCELNYPEELLAEITDNYDFGQTNSSEYLTQYKDLELRKGRALYVSKGERIVALVDSKCFEVPFVDVHIYKKLGVDFEIDGKPFRLSKKESETLTSETVYEEVSSKDDFEEFDLVPVVMGVKIKDSENVITTIIEIFRECSDKKRFIEELVTFCKETVTKIDKQVEIDTIKDFYLTDTIGYESAVVLLLSYLKNASCVADKYIIPLVVNDKASIVFDSKSLQELKGIMILGKENVYPKTCLRRFYEDMHVRIGTNRFAVEILAQHICNASRTDELYKEILQL